MNSHHASTFMYHKTTRRMQQAYNSTLIPLVEIELYLKQIRSIFSSLHRIRLLSLHALQSGYYNSIYQIQFYIRFNSISDSILYIRFCAYMTFCVCASVLYLHICSVICTLTLCLHIMFWSGKRDSNSRPQPWQGCALPAELFPHTIELDNSQKWRPLGDSNPCSRRERAVS